MNSLLQRKKIIKGPFVGILGERYGARNVTFVGGLIAAIGIALCVVAPNIIWLTVFWGGIHGIGFALANTLYRVTVNQYFKKYRATASGIALSGASFGSLGFPFLIDFILNNFTLPGTFLILAGITLHVLPFSLLLKTPFWIQYPKRHKRLVEALQRKKERERQQELIDVQEDETEMTSEISTIPASFLSDVPLETVQFKSLKDPHPLDLRKFRSFGSGLSQHLDNQDPGDGESEEQIEALQRKKEEERQQELIDVPEDETEMTSEISTIPASFLSDVPLEPVQLKSLKDPLDLRKFSSFGSGLSRHLDNQDPGGGESEEQSRLKELEETLDLFHQAPDSDDGSSSTSSTDHQEGEINSSQSSGKTVLTFATGIKTVFMLYKYPMYVVICIGTTQFQLVLTIVIAVLVDYGVDKGIPEFNGKYLINSMAIGDLIGRLCFGWVTDNKYLPKQTFMMAVHIFEGVFLILFPLANSFAFYVTILFFFGMMQGSSMILFSVLLLESRINEYSDAFNII
ncbi:uncharacterized protein [Parasteatoda tepidariorum]|uniref:uncharacterized protein n=1 Tax=Parasteatoda tepidariorum TaxID=114398 RepID=UPI0039BD88A0